MFKSRPNSVRFSILLRSHSNAPPEIKSSLISDLRAVPKKANKNKICGILKNS
jgi:hypothetical protein